MLNILRSTIKSTVIYSFGNLSSKLLGIVLIPLYASKLSIEEYGMLGMLEVTGQIVTAVFGLGLYNAFFRWYWDKQYVDSQKSIFFTILVFVLLAGVLFNVILIPFHQDLSTLLLDTSEHGYLVSLIILISGLEALALIITTQIRLKEKPGLYTILLIAKILTSLTLTIYLIMVRGKKIDGIYEAQLIGNAVFYVLVFWFIRKNVKTKIEFSILLKMLKFSYPLLFAVLAGIIFTITDRYVLRFLSDLSYVGIYSLGFKIANTLKVFIITSVFLGLQPIIFKMMDHPDHKRFYSKVMTYFTYGVMIFALGIALFGKELIKFLAQSNPAYWEAFNVVPVLILGLIFGMLKDVSTIGINIVKRTRVFMWTILMVSTINLGLNILLVPSFGYMGAAYATLASQIIYFLVLLYFAQRFYHIPYEIRKVLIIIALGILLYLLSTLTNEMNLAIRLILKFFLILIFPVLLYFTNFYEKIELDSMRGFWLKWKNLRSFSRNLKDLISNDTKDF